MQASATTHSTESESDKSTPSSSTSKTVTERTEPNTLSPSTAVNSQPPGTTPTSASGLISFPASFSLPEFFTTTIPPISAAPRPLLSTTSASSIADAASSSLQSAIQTAGSASSVVTTTAATTYTSISEAIATALTDAFLAKDPVRFFPVVGTTADASNVTTSSDKENQKTTVVGGKESRTAGPERQIATEIANNDKIITVVAKEETPETHPELEALKRVPRFEPLLKSSISSSSFQWGSLFTGSGKRPAQTPFSLDSQPLEAMCERCRRHIRHCVEVAIRDQKVIADSVNAMDEYCAKLVNTLANRCYHARTNCDQITQGKHADKTKALLTNVVGSLEKLSALLPASERLDHPDLKKKYPNLAKSWGVWEGIVEGRIELKISPSPMPFEGGPNHGDRGYDQCKMATAAVANTFDTHHEDMIVFNSISWAPHEYGLILACASSDGKVSLLTCKEDGTWETAAFPAHSIGANSVSWAPSTIPGSLIQTTGAGGAGMVKRFASAGCDNLVKIWREENGEWKEEAVLEGHSDWVRDVCWAPNIGLPNSYLASCSQDKTVLVWSHDPATGSWTKKALKSDPFPDVVWRVSWSPSGNILAVSCGDNKISMWKENLEGEYQQIGDVSETYQG
ncbi:GTPase-activating protein S13 [Quaeritorhiza haematococci]|nr:GTPase-activating protein S13 [Quaeritorhiza haematococci]